MVGNIQAAGITIPPAASSSFERVTYDVLRYRAGDPTTAGACRSQVIRGIVPQGIPVGWALKLSFGGPERGDAWELTPPSVCPVLFWELKSNTQGNPALALIVDTDDADPSALMVFAARRTAGMTAASRIGTIHGLKPGVMHDIKINAVLSSVDAGQLAVVVNGQELAAYSDSPTLVDGSDHWWSQNVYMYKDVVPCARTRAVYWVKAELYS